jgi:hypothetical protein
VDRGATTATFIPPHTNAHFASVPVDRGGTTQLHSSAH